MFFLFTFNLSPFLDCIAFHGSLDLFLPKSCIDPMEPFHVLCRNVNTDNVNTKVKNISFVNYRPLDLDLVLRYLEEEIILTFRVVRHR